MQNFLRVVVMAATLALAGCATVDGIGRDISGGANRVSGWLN